MKITVELDLSELEMKIIGQTSIERVMNTAADCGAMVAGAMQRDAELGNICMENVDDTKPLATKIWNDVRNAIWKAHENRG